MQKEASVLMTSRNKKIYVLQSKIKDCFESNLERVLDFSKRCVKGSIICTSNLSLTGFAFDRLEEASEFSQYALRQYADVIRDRTLITSVIEKVDGCFYNQIKIIQNGEIIYSQAKTQAFPLNNEEDFITQGKLEDVKFFYIDGIKCAAINCYELRFLDIWKKIQGAEMIFVLARWDKERKKHFEILAQSLAILNQAFVVASDWGNEGFSKGSAIIAPFGDVYQDGKRGVVCRDICLDEIKKMRNYLKIGLEHD